MLVEFTEQVTNNLISVNTEKVYYLYEQGDKAVIVTKITSIAVNESYEEVKKRLGMVITPRAETIALK